MNHVVELSGDLTFANVKAQRESFFNSIVAAPWTFIVNLSHIKKMDSAGIALWVDGMNKANHLGKKMHYCHMPELYKKLVSFYDLDGVITFQSNN